MTRPVPDPTHLAYLATIMPDGRLPGKPANLDSGGLYMASLITIPARQGKAITLRRGQHVKVINTHGQQVVDTWAFNSTALTECMSMEHTRTALSRIMVRVGDSLVTNQRRPILTLVEDTSPGIHDTLIAACDRYRYTLLGCTTYHDNCTDNLAAALAALQATGV